MVIQNGLSQLEGDEKESSETLEHHKMSSKILMLTKTELNQESTKEAFSSTKSHDCLYMEIHDFYRHNLMIAYMEIHDHYQPYSHDCLHGDS